MNKNFFSRENYNVDMESEPIIKFENVYKTYTLYKNDQERFKSLFFKPRNAVVKKALNNISFEIRRGESVGVMGDNGCGKSTLLKTITGVTFPDEGTVTVNGMVAALLELTAGFALDMTGRENVYLKGYILGMDDHMIKEMEDDIVDFAELGEYIDQPVRTYSSGMKMRLGFAINVNINPDILVVDEALSVGDASFRVKCKNKINEILSKNVTVLYVSHNPSSVKEICPRSIYLRKGELIFDGPTEETHLVYQLDKRRILYDKLVEKAESLEKIIDSVDDKSVVEDEISKLESTRSKIIETQAEADDLEKKLDEYRKEHYSAESN